MFVSSIFNDFSRTNFLFARFRIFVSAAWQSSLLPLFYVATHFLLFDSSTTKTTTTAVMRSHKNSSISTWVNCVFGRTVTERVKDETNEKRKKKTIWKPEIRNKSLSFGAFRVSVSAELSFVNVTCLYRLSPLSSHVRPIKQIRWEKGKSMYFCVCVCVYGL